MAQSPAVDTTQSIDTVRTKQPIIAANVIQSRPLTFILGFDVSRPILAVIEQNYLSLEAMAGIGWGKTYLAAELGYVNRILPQNAYEISTSGSYFRLGLEKNAFDDPANKLFYGMRLAGCTGVYNPRNIRVNNDPFTGEQTTANFMNAQSLSAFWLEVVSGLQVEVLSHIQIGFTLRAKFKLNQSDYNTVPYNWLPGYGSARNNTSLGLNYYIIYELSGGKK